MVARGKKTRWLPRVNHGIIGRRASSAELPLEQDTRTLGMVAAGARPITGASNICSIE
jgi:hypothetical protein